jgi:hypothetical protein
MKLNPSMPLPKKVNICGMWYPVTIVPDLKLNGEKVDGYYTRAPGGIFIEKNLGNQERWQTFAHEVIHGWLAMLQIELKDEERKVDAMAYQAYCTLFNTEWQK